MQTVQLAADLGLHGADNLLDLCRMAISHRVGECDHIGTGCGEACRHAHHIGGRHHAIDGATEGGGAGGFHFHGPVLRAHPVHDVRHFGDLLGGGAVEVGAAMAFADRDRDGDAMRAGGIGVLGAAQIGGKRHDQHIGQQHRGTGDLIGVGHGGDQLGRHEGADLDFRHPGSGHGGDPGDFGGGFHAGFGHLQPIPRANLANCHFFAQFCLPKSVVSPYLQGGNFGGFGQPSAVGPGCVAEPCLLGISVCVVLACRPCCCWLCRHFLPLLKRPVVRPRWARSVWRGGR